MTAIALLGLCTGALPWRCTCDTPCQLRSSLFPDSPLSFPKHRHRQWLLWHAQCSPQAKFLPNLSCWRLCPKLNGSGEPSCFHCPDYCLVSTSQSWIQIKITRTDSWERGFRISFKKSRTLLRKVNRSMLLKWSQHSQNPTGTDVRHAQTIM
jgi:hypothetical protein